ncbi:MAG: M48 family metallopeptidase [Lachnospiraceae bacterium]|nr:M48 family metallopeptidase [Lachnospiraceae bacterium]
MISEIKLDIRNRHIDIEVVRSKRKTLGLEIKSGKVKARVPNRTSDRAVKEFILNNINWIEKGLEKWEKISEKLADCKEIFPAPEALSKNEIDIIKQSFKRRVEYFANVMNVTYGRVSIRNQKTRWGSCSSKGNLNFNYRLYFLDTELMDYVIVHELSHRIHMNHSKDFWNVVEKYCPDYRQYRDKLSKIRIL